MQFIAYFRNLILITAIFLIFFAVYPFRMQAAASEYGWALILLLALLPLALVRLFNSRG